jgi:hypothetical protein
LDFVLNFNIKSGPHVSLFLRPLACAARCLLQLSAATPSAAGRCCCHCQSRACDAPTRVLDFKKKPTPSTTPRCSASAVASVTLPDAAVPRRVCSTHSSMPQSHSRSTSLHMSLPGFIIYSSSECELFFFPRHSHRPELHGDSPLHCLPAKTKATEGCAQPPPSFPATPHRHRPRDPAKFSLFPISP